MKESNQKLHCLIRKEWIKASPEEQVRQKLISFMINDLDFPASMISVEKELRHIPHLKLQEDIPNRRADIICFAKGIHPDFNLYPLLLVECKATSLTPKVLQQVTGYNRLLQAYFVAIANDQKIQTGWYEKEKKEYLFVHHLPSYQELKDACMRPNSRKY